MGKPDPQPPNPRSRVMIAVLALAVLALLAGCGASNNNSSSQPAASTSTPNTSPSSAPTTPTRVSTTPSTAAVSTTAPPRPPGLKAPIVEKVEISSPVVLNEGILSASYDACTTDSKPPPLRWKGIPPGTVELMLDIIRFKNVHEQLYIAQAVSGLSPKSHGIDPGKLPAGAIPGTNTAGQQAFTRLCPAKEHHESYVVILFALTRHLPANPGFDALQLRREAEGAAIYQGQFIYTYK